MHLLINSFWDWFLSGRGKGILGVSSWVRRWCGPRIQTSLSRGFRGIKKLPFVLSELAFVWPHQIGGRRIGLIVFTSRRFNPSSSRSSAAFSVIFLFGFFSFRRLVFFSIRTNEFTFIRSVLLGASNLFGGFLMNFRSVLFYCLPSCAPPLPLSVVPAAIFGSRSSFSSTSFRRLACVFITPPLVALIIALL